VVVRSLDPSAKPGSIPVKAEKKIAATVVVKTAAMLQRELDIANARIKSLEHQMRAAGLNPV
jgi:hypothetical protein